VGADRGVAGRDRRADGCGSRPTEAARLEAEGGEGEGAEDDDADDEGHDGTADEATGDPTPQPLFHFRVDRLGGPEHGASEDGEEGRQQGETGEQHDEDADG